MESGRLELECEGPASRAHAEKGDTQRTLWSPLLAEPPTHLDSTNLAGASHTPSTGYEDAPVA